MISVLLENWAFGPKKHHPTSCLTANVPNNSWFSLAGEGDTDTKFNKQSILRIPLRIFEALDFDQVSVRIPQETVINLEAGIESMGVFRMPHPSL